MHRNETDQLRQSAVSGQRKITEVTEHAAIDAIIVF
jgi:hypothetical protein